MADDDDDDDDDDDSAVGGLKEDCGCIPDALVPPLSFPLPPISAECIPSDKYKKQLDSNEGIRLFRIIKGLLESLEKRRRGRKTGVRWTMRRL